MGRLTGKVALVTGGASGIGRAAVELFAREGAMVVASDIAPDSAMASASILPLKQDVTDERDWIAAIAAAEQKFGALSVLVNNAGTGLPKPLTEMTLDEWRGVVAVNLDGTFLGIKHAVPAIAKSGGGSIVNISSMRGIAALASLGPYCAAKAGVAMLSKVAALECAEAKNNIRVNTVHPGYVDTPLVSRTWQSKPEFKANVIAKTPIGRFGLPGEIAQSILYLASDESSFVTGSSLVIDGGYTAQ